MQRQDRYERWTVAGTPTPALTLSDPRKTHSGPSPNTRKRLHRFMDMLLTYPSPGSIAQADKILAGYPWLRAEWEPRIIEACERLHDEAREARAHIRDL